MSEQVIQILRQQPKTDDINGTDVGLHRLTIKTTVEKSYPVFLTTAAIIFILAVSANCSVLVNLVRLRKFREPTCLLLGNLTAAGLFMAAVAMPLSIGNFVLAHWVYGRFLCFCFPMIQNMPIYASVLTLTAIQVDRRRKILYPSKPRINTLVCVVLSWVTALCVVLPLAAFLDYIDLHDYIGERANGVGLCLITKIKQIKEYVRWVFILFYILPACASLSLFISISRELTALRYSESLGDRATMDSTVEWLGKCKEDREGSEDRDLRSPTTTCQLAGCQDSVPSDIAYSWEEHRYMGLASASFILLWLPLQILILITQIVNDQSTPHKDYYDIIYPVLSLIGYSSTVVTPMLTHGCLSALKGSRRRRNSLIDNAASTTWF